MCFVVIFGFFPILESFGVFLLEVLKLIYCSPVAFEPLADLNHLWLPCFKLLVPSLFELLAVEFNFPIQLLRLLRLSVCIARDDKSLTEPLLKYFPNFFCCFLSSDVSVDTSDYHGMPLNIPVLVLNGRRVLNRSHSFVEDKKKNVGDYHCECSHFRCKVCFILPQIIH